MKDKGDYIRFFQIRRILYVLMETLFGGVMLTVTSSRKFLDYTKRPFESAISGNAFRTPLLKFPKHEYDIYEMFVKMDLVGIGIDSCVAFFTMAIDDYYNVLSHSEMLLAILLGYEGRISTDVLENSLNIIDYRMYFLSKGDSDSHQVVIRRIHNAIVERKKNGGKMKNVRVP